MLIMSSWREPTFDPPAQTGYQWPFDPQPVHACEPRPVARLMRVNMVHP